MKTLSIKQPWASLIALGIKDIENRTWKTNYRGRIFIHAASDKKVYGRLFTDEQLEICQEEHLRGKLPEVKDLPLGAIIGEVDIVDCVINHPSIWAEQTFYPIDRTEGYPNSVKPIYNWVLANAVVYDTPILNVKGKLSLWEYKEGN